ncbi:gliding motility-associated C-terminal domain-containing protein [Myroides sp. 1354]|uniref:gliding motility-associated C-terminal domain-containing protein n=1 Tax=unclassified Myroides TaxID=2642485 RepID=UPI002576F3C7|nr:MULTISPECIES: gliding motility-associated C-terminal domain-containing protein [unclassified Myroides]MDM1044770.1 gliding motility-associated C-terminal domain-containing protein [Myroides sp. R163-1]MDM1055483.1 gliding motility-associated C-terminal domain-containing protein [Myroides sp. 1354]MDM1068780.1 gliding motility-associated C-terminal domain-containing protein [Myroides sp. 1372]
MKNKVIQTCLFLALANTIYAQKQVKFINEGILSVSSDDVVSIDLDFENTELGKVTNDGKIIYLHHFLNDGAYGITTNGTTSTTIFRTEGNLIDAKQIRGNQMASFYNIIFDSPVSKVAFDLRNNIDAHGVVDFQSGIVAIDSTYNPITKVSQGMFTFQNGAKAINADNTSHIQGIVEKIGKDAFTYPIGDKEKYRYARISAPKEMTDVFIGQYIYQDENFFNARTNTVGVIKKLNTTEYWLIEKAEKNASDVLLTLSWDEETTSPEILVNSEEELHIVRWDPKAQIWVDEGGVVDMSTKEVTTIATVKGYGFFTLATVKKDWILDGDVVIYNLVTPDGDGKNDYFIIDNIQHYPNNRVEIFNRWGARVYETKGYDPLGDGSTNVFTGYSEGKVTIDKGSKLPSGTYYYVITYEYKDENGSRMIKKAANLHLETN